MEIKIGDKVLIFGFEQPRAEGKVLNVAKHFTSHTSVERINRMEYKYLVQYVKTPMFGKTTNEEDWFDEDFVYKIIK